MTRRRRFLIAVLGVSVLTAAAVHFATRPPGPDTVRRQFRENLAHTDSPWNAADVAPPVDGFWAAEAVLTHDGAEYAFSARCPVDAPDQLATVEVRLRGVRNFLAGGREVVIFRGDVNPEESGRVIVLPRYAPNWRHAATWIEPKVIEFASALQWAAR